MTGLLLLLALLAELDVAAALLRAPSGAGPSAVAAVSALGALALHLGAAGLCAEALRGRLPPAVTLGVCALLPALGPLVCVLLAVPPRARGAQAGVSWEVLRRQAADAAAERRRGQQRVGVDIDPIIDAIRDEDPEVRSAAVEALQREMSPRAVRLLQEAQRDPVFEVKLRATEALAAIAKAAPGGPQARARTQHMDELDLLFARRDFAGLAAACARLQRSGVPIDPEDAEAVHYWAGRHDARRRR